MQKELPGLSETFPHVPTSEHFPTIFTILYNDVCFALGAVSGILSDISEVLETISDTEYHKLNKLNTFSLVI